MNGNRPVVGYVVGFMVGALVVGTGLGLVVRDRGAEIRSLEGRVTQARRELEEARTAADVERRRLQLFQDYIAEDAQADMFDSVTSAAVIGGAAASGCLPGYTDPRCDGWYDPSTKNWAWRQISEFMLARQVEEYGKDLVSRTAEDVEETIDLTEG